MAKDHFACARAPLVPTAPFLLRFAGRRSASSKVATSSKWSSKWPPVQSWSLLLWLNFRACARGRSAGELNLNKRTFLSRTRARREKTLLCLSRTPRRTPVASCGHGHAPPADPTVSLFLPCHAPPQCSACLHSSSSPRVRPTTLPYRGTSLIRNSAPLGPYNGTMPRALWWP